MGFRGDLLRPHTGGGAHRVTFIELFFDLVFVFAVTQVSHLLIRDESPLGVVHTLMLGAAIWWVWVDTAWVTNWLNPEKGAVRVMLVVLMLLGLLMSSAIPEAFGDKALLFALTFVTLQVARSLFTVFAFARRRPEHAGNFVRITIWLATSGVLWIAGALLPDAQLWLWLAAILLDYTGPRARFFVPGMGRAPLSSWDVSGAHMAERVSLFVIIALGESIIVSGSTFSDLGVDGATVSAFLAAFASAVLMWLLYFSHSERRGSEYISEAAERGLIAQVAYTYVPVPMVLGIVLTAVADHTVLVSPDVGSSWAVGLVCAGSAVYLVGIALFRRATGGPWLLSNLLGFAALVALFFTHPVLSPVAVSWGSNLVLLAVVVADELSLRRDGGVATNPDSVL
ncbi:low temperature requirement protein A [Leifsonia bigeumensis]|uniref:Low temperature requirement protein A n=1 Tax=Leifsonella bigeumensis TaxID=433643 RepID=A0ABP7FB60_9MICO